MIGTSSNRYNLARTTQHNSEKRLDDEREDIYVEGNRLKGVIQCIVEADLFCQVASYTRRCSGS